MKITIKIEPVEENENMVKLTFRQKGKDKNMAILRATARMMRAIGWEYSALHSESKFIKEHLSKSEDA